MFEAFDSSRHLFKSPKFRSVVEEAVRFFNETPICSVPPNQGFLGTGVYALYYVSDKGLYARMGVLNGEQCVQPIYVGKAVPYGWRTGRTTQGGAYVLYNRLREHARSINQTFLVQQSLHKANAYHLLPQSVH